MDIYEMAKGATVAAHHQKVAAAYLTYYPAHEPREGDSHYHLFHEARKRILAAGVGCWIANDHCQGGLELHHEEVEYAAALGVDLDRLKTLHPEYGLTDAESFLAWIESEGNLRVLCAFHHRSKWGGIHHVDYPVWKLQRIWKPDIPYILAPAG